MVLNLNNYVELIALLIALIFYKDLARHNFFIYFIPFLAVTSIIEIYAIGKERPFKNVMYNYFQLFQYIFYTALFYKNLHFPKSKKIVLYSFPLFLIFFLTNIFFVYGPYEYNNYTSILGSFFIVIFICMHFYEAIIPQTSQVKLFASPFFWVAVGLLFFKLGSVIMFAMFKFLSSIDLQNKGVVIFQTIIKSLNVILYGSLSVAFILCRNNKKTSSSPS